MATLDLLLNTNVPIWSLAILAIVFWLIQNSLKRFLRLWALITLPATLLHELAHLGVGMALGAQPSSFSLWPKKVGTSAWRLGYVGFTSMRWWNGGAVAIAPLLWVIPLAAIARYFPSLPAQLSLQHCLAAAVGIVWLLIALSPSRSDWRLAVQYWPSALVLLAVWTLALYAVVFLN
jgi:hypothetical protein